MKRKVLALDNKKTATNWTFTGKVDGSPTDSSKDGDQTYKYAFRL